jgi:HPt (histidine-containing phosphotransfer) domain-containing protein
MDDFLTKPIHIGDLWAAIDRLVPNNSLGLKTDLIDQNTLLAVCGGDSTILEKICQTFQAGLPVLLESVRAAMQKGDARRLRESAHKLNGIIGAFSSEAGAITSDLEDCAENGQLKEAQALFQRLDTVARELMMVVPSLTIELLKQKAR